MKILPEMPKDKMRIRSMTTGDLPTVAILSEQLGYPIPTTDLTHRFSAMSRSSDHHLAVALSSGMVNDPEAIKLLMHLGYRGEWRLK